VSGSVLGNLVRKRRMMSGLRTAAAKAPRSNNRAVAFELVHLRKVILLAQLPANFKDYLHN
jgi:hypothetical protein